MSFISAWVIYQRPLDYPQGYVMRRWVMGEATYPTQQAVYAPTLEQVRALVPLGCVNLRRQPADEPQIVETWI